MANYSGMGLDLPFSACGDLNDYQYCCVKAACTAFYVEPATGGSDPMPLGILQNDPYSTGQATVRVAGVSKVWYSSSGAVAISYGNFLTCIGATGQLGLATGSAYMGIALEDAPTGSGFISMLIRPTLTQIAGTR